MVELKGVIPALTTPFKEDRSLDLAALRRLNDIVLDDGVDGVLVAGCSGETWALDDDERLAIFKAAVDQTAGRVPVIGGCADIFVSRVIDKIRLAERAGCDAVMITAPPYIMPTQDDIYTFFKEIIAESAMPIMVYNHPKRTGVALSVDLMDRLADEPTIVALKESSKDWNQLSQFIRRCRDRLNVLGGYIGLTGLAALSEGAVGYVDSSTSVLGPLSPQFFRAATTGDLETARAIQVRITKLRPGFDASGTFPAGIKAALDILGRPGGWPRDPIKPVTPEGREIMRRVLIDAGILEGEEARKQA